MDFVDRLAKDQSVDRDVVEREFFKTARPTSLIQRFATPAEVSARVRACVCSPLAARAINGTALRVDGGVVQIEVRRLLL